eukprot:COSAG01_NODE_8087_length_2925_cov_11.000000_4_plen_111_part_00
MNLMHTESTEENQTLRRSCEETAERAEMYKQNLAEQEAGMMSQIASLEAQLEDVAKARSALAGAWWICYEDPLFATEHRPPILTEVLRNDWPRVRARMTPPGDNGETRGD